MRSEWFCAARLTIWSAGCPTTMLVSMSWQGRLLTLTIYAAPIDNACELVQEHRTHLRSLQVLPAELRLRSPNENPMCSQCSGLLEMPFLIRTIRHSQRLSSHETRERPIRPRVLAILPFYRAN